MHRFPSHLGSTGCGSLRLRYVFVVDGHTRLPVSRATNCPVGRLSIWARHYHRRCTLAGTPCERTNRPAPGRLAIAQEVERLTGLLPGSYAERAALRERRRTTQPSQRGKLRCSIIPARIPPGSHRTRRFLHRRAVPHFRRASPCLAQIPPLNQDSNWGDVRLANGQKKGSCKFKTSRPNLALADAVLRRCALHLRTARAVIADCIPGLDWSKTPPFRGGAAWRSLARFGSVARRTLISGIRIDSSDEIYGSRGAVRIILGWF